MIRFFILLFILGVSSGKFYSQVYGNPIVSWDFANGIPEDWEEGIISTTNSAHWEYRGPSTSPDFTVGARGSCSAIASPIGSETQANGFIIFDGNYWDDPGAFCGGGLGSGIDPAPHTAWLITNSINLSANNSCVLTFQQQYRHFQTTTKVFISVDGGGTWIEISSNTGIQSFNTEWKSVNISEWAANQPDVRFKFEYSGLYYWWLLDDITVFEPNENDLILTKVQFTDNVLIDDLTTLNNLEYSQYPLGLLPVLKFKSTILNVGSSDQTGVRLNVNLVKDDNTSVFNQTSSPIVSTVSSETNLDINGTFTPSTGVGNYEATFTLLQDALDATPLNNLDSLNFQITPFTYAKDKGPAEDANPYDSFYDAYQVAYGNFFENKGAIRYCHTIQAGIAEGTQPGKMIRGVVYNQSLDTLLGYTIPYSVNYADLNEPGEEHLVYLDFENPFQLQSDSIYFMAVEELDSIQPFFMSRSGKSFGESSIIRYNSVNASILSAKSFMVRLTILPQNQQPGCMDSSALNFEASATIDDGSCDYPGCANEDADNYNALANFDDGTCMVGGCTDSTAFNYNPLATYQGIPCIFRGCTAFNALNFDATANEDDGSCVFLYTALDAGQLSGCPPFVLQLNNHNEFSPDAVCTFTIDGESILDACASVFDYTFEEPGSYELNYTISIGNASADTSLTIQVFAPSDEPQLSFDSSSLFVTCGNCTGNTNTWYLDGELMASGSEISLNTVFDGLTRNGYYSVVTTNPFGCVTASDSIFVLQPYLSASTTSGCAPVSVIFNNLTDTVSGMVCSLNTGISIIENFNNSAEVEYTAEGNYIAELTCTAADGLGTADISVAISSFSLPLLAIDSSSMTVVCTNAESFSEFTWNIDGVISEGSSSQPLGGDVYQLQAFNSAGCGGSALLIVNDIESISIPKALVYPNPASEFLRIENPEAASYRILNCMGQIIAEYSNPGKNNSIQVSNWPSGIYHIQWLGNKQTNALRFEILH